MSLTAAAAALMIGSAIPQAVAQGPEDTPVPAAQEATPQAEQAPLATPETVTDEPGASDAQTGDQGLEGSEIIVTRRPGAPPGDPLEAINETSFQVVQSVDKAVVEPVAKAYNKGIPHPVREGLRNVFSNLQEPVVFAAYMLELKPGKALETAGRFLINSTLGLAGIIDVAKRKPFNLPYRPNGLANVLGYYGVGPGPYMYLPIIGPTTVRDLIGDSIDRLASPAMLGKPFTKPEVAIPMITLAQLGERAAFDDEINRIRDTDNPYATYRELYLRQREAEIEALHGRIMPDVVPVYGRMMPTAGSEPQDTPELIETPETPEPAAPAAIATPVEPTIRYVSEPVVQPLPEGYGNI